MIPELIFDWAKRTPDRTAIVYNGRPLSYGSFAGLIARARSYFVRRGYTGPGYALLAVHNLLDFWILSLALRSLGLTTVMARFSAPLDLGGLADARLVVTTPAEAWPNLKDLCVAHGLALLSVSLDGEPELGLGETQGQFTAGGHILRTSGTTGSYKMVLMSPAVDAVFLRRKAGIAGLNQDSVLCVFAFAAWSGVGYKWAASPWYVGGTTLIEQGNASHALSRPGITHAATVPAILARILAAPADGFPRNDAMQLIVGGGPMTRSQIEEVKARITSHLFSEFGSTEVSGIALTPINTPEDQLWHSLVPDSAVEIVDEHDRPTPVGEIGRIRVATAGGPAGYLHDEAATREFFKNGFFYTGDLAVMRADGRVTLQGRLTDIINIWGRKISPAPFEDRLAEVLGVGGVCLFSMQSDGGEEEVHAVIETPTPIEPERLIAVFGRELSGFPTIHIHQVAALPRNQMGKLIRRDARTLALSGKPPVVR